MAFIIPEDDSIKPLQYIIDVALGILGDDSIKPELQAAYLDFVNSAFILVEIGTDIDNIWRCYVSWSVCLSVCLFVYLSVCLPCTHVVVHLHGKFL